MLFLLTVGSFLLTILAFLLTIDKFSFFTYNWSFFACNLTFLTYIWSFFVVYSGKVRLIRALRDFKQRSLSASKNAPTVSKKASPQNFPGDFPRTPLTVDFKGNLDTEYDRAKVPPYNGSDPTSCLEVYSNKQKTPGRKGCALPPF